METQSNQKFKIMKITRIIPFVIITLLILFGCNAQTERAGFEVLHKEEAQELLTESPDMLLLDVRTPEEFAEGHIEGARNLNFFDSDFREQLDKLDKEEPIFIYCRSGNRSGKAGKIMQELGFEQVYDLEGGYMAWY